MLAHELRNPLAAVRNAVATATLDEARRPRALEIAQRQADQLGRMIDDLLDVARITQGRIELRRELVRLADVVERAVDTMRPFIEARGLALVVTHPSGPVRVEADPARLEQVFVNLLSNAAKYTNAGGRIDVVAESAGEGRVAVRIRDTGMGIAPEMMPRMWDLFAQADREIDRKQGGLGIGLTVARRLVELHGARIEARSDGVGKGAEFVVTLDAQPVMGEEAASAPADEPARRGGAHVLLVEDNRDTAESLTMLLDLYGHRVRTVYDGVAALDAANAEVPDVMLVDIGLPGMDGYEVARRIRRDMRLRDVTLIALTGYGREEDRRQALAAGFDHHLVKPVNPETLNGLVMSVVGVAPEKAAAAR
jgi:two-component system CheB/CheR fusion protein